MSKLPEDDKILNKRNKRDHFAGRNKSLLSVKQSRYFRERLAWTQRIIRDVDAIAYELLNRLIEPSKKNRLSYRQKEMRIKF
jgi:hypothetical protein